MTTPFEAGQIAGMDDDTATSYAEAVEQHEQRLGRPVDPGILAELYLTKAHDHGLIEDDWGGSTDRAHFLIDYKDGAGVAEYTAAEVVARWDPFFNRDLGGWIVEDADSGTVLAGPYDTEVNARDALDHVEHGWRPQVGRDLSDCIVDTEGTVIINGTAVAVPPGAIAYKYTDPIDSARWVYDEAYAGRIQRSDPSLLVWPTPEPHARKRDRGLER